ncbi:MAG: DUF3307 domain-containing protein [Chitinophagaceae bacterium]
MILLLKLVLAHLLTDFVLQPTSWVEDRNAKHFASIKLYLHGMITGIVAWIITGWQYWPIALIILVTHTLIDGWKSYQPKTAKYFLADQFTHLAIIVACCTFLFFDKAKFSQLWLQFNGNIQIWKLITGIVFLTFPAGILIGQLTRQWREKILSDKIEVEGLASAGKWIGIVERMIILAFVLMSQFSAIGLLVAAKGIIRFNEKDRQEAKTEYLVIGTLLSIALSVATGLAIKA